MRLWQDGLIALLATIGLTAIIWLPIRSICFLPEIRRRLITLIPVQGNCEELDPQVRTLSLLYGECGITGEILLVDCGLSEEGRKLCRLMAHSCKRVSLCEQSEIEQYFTQGELP